MFRGCLSAHYGSNYQLTPVRMFHITREIQVHPGLKILVLSESKSYFKTFTKCISYALMKSTPVKYKQVEMPLLEKQMGSQRNPNAAVQSSTGIVNTITRQKQCFRNQTNIFASNLALTSINTRIQNTHKHGV